MVNVNVQLPNLPRGYEYTGEYRAIGGGEYWYAGRHSGVKQLQVGQAIRSGYEYHVVRRTEWEPRVGEGVYVLTGRMTVELYLFCNDDASRRLYHMGLMFRTEEIAEEARSTVISLIQSMDLNNQEMTDGSI